MREIILETYDADTMEMKYSGRVVLSENGVVSFVDCSEKFIAEMNDYGVVGLAGGGVQFPRDGAAFMRALVEETNRTSFVRAREVK